MNALRVDAEAEFTNAGVLNQTLAVVAAANLYYINGIDADAKRPEEAAGDEDEEMLEGFRFPMQQALERAHQLRQQAATPRRLTSILRAAWRRFLPWERRAKEGLFHALRSATYYRYLAYIWKQVLFEGHRLELSPPGVRLIVGDREREIRRTVALQKDKNRRLARTFNAAYLHANNTRFPPPGEKLTISSTDEDPAELDLVRRSFDLDEGVAMMLRLPVHAEIEEEILKTRLAGLDGLTLQEIFMGWHLLCELASGILRGSQRSLSTSDHITTCRLAPRLPRSELELAFASALEIEEEKTAKFLSLLTYRGRPEESLFDCPLVDVDEGHCTLLTAAVLAGNLTYLAEGWLRRGGFDFGVRGKLYEREVCTRLDVLIKANPALRGCGATARPIKYTPRKLDPQETDAVLWLGNLLVVVEVKNTVLRTDPYQRHKYLQELADKARQARRKRQYLEEHLPECLNKLKQHGYNPPQPKRIIEVVVTNLTFGVGESFEGTPVVDASSVFDFLRAAPPDLTTERGRLESAFEGLVRCPPWLQRGQAAATFKVRTMQALDGFAGSITAEVCDLSPSTRTTPPLHTF